MRDKVGPWKYYKSRENKRQRLAEAARPGLLMAPCNPMGQSGFNSANDLSAEVVLSRRCVDGGGLRDLRS